MNKRQANRLLNVARALRESPKPEAFDMHSYFNISNDENWCGTPACALGHFGSRRDLQSLMRPGYSNPEGFGDSLPVLFYNNNKQVDFASRTIEKYFGITSDQTYELFSMIGCGKARTVDAAATYIENFVRHNYQER